MSWFTKLLGKDGSNQLAIDSKFSAARFVGMPMEVGSRGSYSMHTLSGTMAAGLAANSEIFQWRWTHATRLCVLRSIACSGGGIVAFAAGFGAFRVCMARSWSVDGTGGTAVVFNTNNTNKRRTDFPLSDLSNTGVRIASTAALGAGTKTLDTNDFAGQTFGVTATAGATLGNPGTNIWSRNTNDEFPGILETNEGFVIKATVPATGTWTFGVEVQWAEIDPSELVDWA